HNGILTQRFHRDTRVRAIESLLYERVPLTRVPQEKREQHPQVIRHTTTEERADRVWKEETPVPHVYLYGNGRLASMVTNSGGGWSQWNGLDLTRWRADPALECWGTFIYLRDTDSGSVWGVARQPLEGDCGACSVRFSADRAQFTRTNLGIK